MGTLPRASLLCIAASICWLYLAGCSNPPLVEPPAPPGKLSTEDAEFFSQEKKLQGLLSQTEGDINKAGFQPWTGSNRLSPDLLNVVKKMTVLPSHDSFYLRGIWRPLHFRSKPGLMLTGIRSEKEVGDLKSVSWKEIDPRGLTIITAAPAAAQGEPYVWGNIVYFAWEGIAFTHYGAPGAYHIFPDRLCMVFKPAYRAEYPICFRAYVDSANQAYIETTNFQSHISKVVAVLPGDALGLMDVSDKIQLRANQGRPIVPMGIEMVSTNLQNAINKGLSK